jgi:leucyl-tRNA synthetase
MLSPLCPHVAEELWQRLDKTGTITYVPFPEADPALLSSDTIEIPVQVNGKVRGRIRVSPEADEASVLAAALGCPEVAPFLAGKEILLKFTAIIVESADFLFPGSGRVAHLEY